MPWVVFLKAYRWRQSRVSELGPSNMSTWFHPGLWLLGLALLFGGCAATPTSTNKPLVIFLDGAGWSGSDIGVRNGLREAGFQGDVETFPWTSLLGPLPDHFLAARNKAKGKDLAERIVERRRQRPTADLHLMGLSAGTAVLIFGLEQLPAGVQVDHVVLFAPSISADHDLSGAMEHVRGHLYATCSPFDGILVEMRLDADGRTGPPAGLYGLRIPSQVERYDLYSRVVNLPWRPAYADLGWRGDHTGATGSRFVREIIGPRVLSDEPQPLNRALAPPWMAYW
jgi:hypothetical protein